MMNKYIFDYRLVLEEDSSFEKFVNVETVDNTQNVLNNNYIEELPRASAL